MANVDIERKEEYLRHRITATVFAPGEVCGVRIKKPNEGRVSFTEYVDPVLRGVKDSGVPGDKDAYQAWLLSRAIGRARAAIVLESTPELEEKRFKYLPPEPITVPEEELELIILRALRVAKRLDRNHTGRVALDAMGICETLNLDYDAFIYSNQRLIDRDSVEPLGGGWDPHNYLEAITEYGLQALDELERAPQAATQADHDLSHDVFLSFSFVNDAEAADIKQRLEAAGLTVFIATHEVEGGDDFAEEIREGLQSSRELCLLVSRESLESEWVITEWGAAWVLQRRITPVLMGVGHKDLPERLSRRQCVPFDEIDRYIDEAAARWRTGSPTNGIEVTST